MKAEIQMRTPIALAHKICALLEQERDSGDEEKMIAATFVSEIYRFRSVHKVGVSVEPAAPNEETIPSHSTPDSTHPVA